MKYASLVAWREYAENAKTKGFWIGIFLVPFMLLCSIQIPILLEKKGTPTRYFVLLDQSGKFDAVVESALEKTRGKQVLEALNEYARENLGGSRGESNDTNPKSLESAFDRGGAELYLKQLQPHLKADAPAFREPRRAFQRVKLPAGINAEADLAWLAQELKPYLRAEKKIEVNGKQVDLHAAILIPRDIEQQIIRPQARTARGPTKPGSIEYWSANLADSKVGQGRTGSGLGGEIEQAVNAEIRRREFLERGLDAAAIRQVEQTYAPFASLNPKKETGKEKVSSADVIRQWAPSGFVYLLWVAIFAIVQMLLNNIVEEKSNRIIEVLLSSVTPGELMMGKLFGIAAIGLTMVGAWMVALFCILSWKTGGASDLAGQLLTVMKTSNLVPMFSLYFLLGYLLYAALILSLGSVCNTIKEAQNYMSMITMTMMVPLLTLTFIPKDPNGTLARVLSWIPIYTPFTMMNRAAADPPLFDLIGTMVLLVVSTIAALWMAGKIFRIGILRTGQPPKIVEMLRWIRG
jgi:ABC-2 type transport system permease protein